MKNDQHAIIFDFFGVISSEVSPVWLGQYFEEAEAERIKREIVSQADDGTISERQFFETLSSLSGIPAAQVLDDWLKLAVIDPAFPALISQMRRKVSVALLSNAPGEFLHRILRREDLYQYFDYHMISSEEGLVKPDPALFLRLTDKMGIDPGKCLMVDDNPDNLNGALTAGIPGLLYHGIDALEEKLNGWLAAFAAE